jgi:hypothetical protein
LIFEQHIDCIVNQRRPKDEGPTPNVQLFDVHQGLSLIVVAAKEVSLLLIL